jgi:hypothetical protein
VLLTELGSFDKIAVEFVSGATPTAHLFDAEGNDVDSFVLGKNRLSGVRIFGVLFDLFVLV